MPLVSPEIASKKLVFSEFPLGYSILEDGVVFRLFSPKADVITLCLFDSYEHTHAATFLMEKDDSGIWNFHYEGLDILGKWYAFQIESTASTKEFEHTKRYVADPWSKHVTSRNHYLGHPKTKLVAPELFDWEDDDYVTPEDPRDLMIYETHIKDMVAHPSARTYVQGVYNDFREARVGGIKHLKRLGVNAVEFLPLQKFAYFEPPFNKEIEGGLVNTWNPYGRNYWGYMTSFFFAPETIYASDGNLEPGGVVGRSNKAEFEFKQLVKELHKEDISVIMDVVYNHASQYDLNPLKKTAKEHYFKIDENGHYINDSWTGNDIKTDSEYSRQMIVESVKYWMTEYHIDGFRFDLAGIIDWETVDLIREEAKKINPDVILIAEPWGGEYKPEGFSDHGWASWNDRIRNGIKGYDPLNNKGFIFGDWSHGSNRYAMENFFRGTLEQGEHGLFNTSAHSVNYIESHDGYTLGDFIRIALHPARQNRKFKNKLSLTKLDKQELTVAKLGALALFVSQGISMIHAGQEWARSKLIVDHEGNDPNACKLDHDSYNKDNETNWLNFNEIDINRSLFEYYQCLIELRKNSPALRKAEHDDINFKVYNEALHFTFSIDGKNSGDNYDYFISLNGDQKESHRIDLPKGDWEMVVNEKKCDTTGLKSITKDYTVPPCSGVVLRKLRVSLS